MDMMNKSVGSKRWKLRGSPRTYGAAFGGFLILTLGSLFWGASSKSLPEARLRLGVELLGKGEFQKAREEFLGVSQEGDSSLASAAFHNLGLLSLKTAMERDGSSGVQAAQEAIGLAEASLKLAPGSQAPAWNLEMALRRLADSSRTELIAPDSQPTQQVGEGGADTEDEGIGEGESAELRRLGSGSGLSQEAARRLLASFRLMEREGTLGMIRDRLRDGPYNTALPRRGPPW